VAFFTRRLARTDDSGMTLVEVLAAMLIFAIVSTGLVYAMLQTLALTRDARARQVALNLASQEIDRTLAIQGIDALLAEVDSVSSRTVNGDNFTVGVQSNWVSDPDVELKCGASPESGVLRYKRINVEVTWDNMRDGTDPVRADTIVEPGQKFNDPALGTILVSVLNGDGEGRPGVTVSAKPAKVPNGATVLAVTPAATDAQGCSYILKVTPGNYDVSVKRDNYVNMAHEPSSTNEAVAVTAGSSATLNFQYDLHARYDLKLAGDYTGDGATKVRVPKNLPVTFLSSYGTSQLSTPGTGTSVSHRVFPLSSGYTLIAGAYADTAGSTGCLSPNPAAWTVEDDDGDPVPGLAGFGAALAGSTIATHVPMGVVKVENLTGSTTVTAKTADEAKGDDPGCVDGLTYDFGNGLVSGGGTTAYLALPYGSWEFSGVAPGNITILTSGARHESVFELAPEPGE